MNVKNIMIVAKHLPIRATYEKTKEKLKRDTLQYGVALTSGYFVCKGAAEGVSAMLGTVSSLVYINTLSKKVDEIEKSSSPPFQLFVPLGTAIFEKLWNEAPFSFDFDYQATLFGFLVYKGALLNILYEIVRDMLIERENYDFKK